MPHHYLLGRRRTNRVDEAGQEYDAAIALAGNARERDFLRRSRLSLGG
jgi:predicted RNA polymerase sigma factor